MAPGKGKQTQRGEGGLTLGRGAPGLAHVTPALIIWSLSARWVEGWEKEGVSPGLSSVSEAVDSLSPLSGLHAGAAGKAQHLWSSEGSAGALAGVPRRQAQASEWLTCLFSSGSFCRIILAPFCVPHMGKTVCSL